MERVRLSLSEQFRILGNYAYHNIKEQIIVVIPVCLYMALFQIVIMQYGFSLVAWLTGGIACVILGLTFFLEGVKIGLVPIGEAVGNTLPKKSSTGVILIFAFALGILGAMGEPVLGSLQLAGAQLKEEHAPLLYRLLVLQPNFLVYTVAFGVGVAVFLGTMRFLYGWSLKPIVIPIITLAIIMTIIAARDHTLGTAIGLAWDTGAVIVGPVLCPLVLALGLGVCRATGKGDPSMAGFGMVGLISVMPIISVITLTFVLSFFDGHEKKSHAAVPVVAEKTVAAPAAAEPAVNLPAEISFAAYYAKVRLLSVPTELPYAEYAKKISQLSAADNAAFRAAFVVNDEHRTIVVKNAMPPELRSQLPGLLAKLGYDLESMPASIFKKAYDIRVADESKLKGTIKLRGDVPPEIRKQIPDILKTIGFSFKKPVVIESFVLGLRAILPIFIFLYVVMRLLKERGPPTPQLILSVVFAVFGLFLFNFGLSVGLSQLGNQSGDRLPTAFLDYLPLFPDQKSLYPSELGKVIVVIFALILGYGATLAEPAFNVLGQQVEEVTQGAFKKNLFGQAVALGVGVGASLGIASLLYHVNLLYLLLPPYALLVILTLFNQEKFVNIAWDGGAVTTGPITVPLKLAIGLSLSAATGAGEGFGVIALASAYPVLNILLLGLFLGNKKNDDLAEAEEQS